MFKCKATNLQMVYISILANTPLAKGLYWLFFCKLIAKSFKKNYTPKNLIKTTALAPPD